MPDTDSQPAGLCSYEEAVQHLRDRPGNELLLHRSYLDRDNADAARRFAASDEFRETARLFGLQPSRPLSVLDVGCGNGIASYAFAALRQRVVSVDVDASDDVGIRATARLSKNVAPATISTAIGSAETLPFASETFDRVYARQALHHFGDLAAGVAECARVLRPGGLFLAAREHVVTDDAELQAFLADHPLQALHGGENAYPVATYVAALEAAGLRVVSVHGPFDSPLNLYPLRPDDISSYLAVALARRIGRPIAGLLSRIPALRDMYGRRLSRISRYPGRLYSFLCTR